MQWLRSDFRFDLRRCIFVLSSKDRASSPILEEIQRSSIEATDLNNLRSVVEAIVLDERPELQGCQISHVQFDYSRQCWMIGVFHGSLQETLDGDMCSEHPLRKEVWAEELVETPKIEIRSEPLDVGTKNNWAEDEVDKTWR